MRAKKRYFSATKHVLAAKLHTLVLRTILHKVKKKTFFEKSFLGSHKGAINKTLDQKIVKLASVSLCIRK